MEKKILNTSSYYMEKKITRILKDKRQTRTTIPKEFVDKAKVESGDKLEWTLKGDKLKAEVKKDE